MGSSASIRRLGAGLAAFVFFAAPTCPSSSLAGEASCQGSAQAPGSKACLPDPREQAEGQLNAVYRHLLAALDSKPDAATALREAQRKWVAFREAECALQGLASQGGSVHPVIVSNCLEGMATARTADLVFMLTCEEGDFSCLLPNPSGPDVADRTPTRLQRPGLRFEASEVLERFTVSGLWFPTSVNGPGRLAGPALFTFAVAGTGQSFSVMLTDMVLLPPGDGADRDIANADRLELSDLVTRLRAQGPIRIPLSAAHRARRETCRLDAGEPPAAQPNRDQCLTLGDAIVDLQDVDFDGRPELVFRQVGRAQRGHDAYRVWTLASPGGPATPASGLPLTDLDGLSTINLSKRLIVLQESNGACASAEATYGFDPRQGPGLRPTSRVQFVAGPGVDCSKETYRPVRTSGKGWVLERSKRENVAD